ncbi:tetratricopeptide repeat protein 23 [Amia ocellicauda]|uniref:tetratricopeptide repeat protein 23 n=1 Tax=Amia ocellicauda TaxID=2972642 RepID=UPI0034645D44
MLSPEDRLALSEDRAQAFAGNQEHDAAIQELARCVALTRLVYGDGHWRLAEAHARLAQGYLQLKGLALQAQEHTEKARTVAVSSPLGPPDGAEKQGLLKCLITIFHTKGGAAQQLGNLKDAEHCLERAERIVGELQKLEGVSREETASAECDIAMSFARLYQKQGQWAEALCQCERALRVAEDRAACSVHREMAAIEQAEGRLDRAIQHLLQAHSMALSQCPAGGLEGAHIAHSLALAYSTAGEPGYNDSAVQFFEESLSGYRSSLKPQDPTVLSVQDDYCRYLILSGNQERAVTLLKESLPLKKVTFGELSVEVAETYQILGGVEMAQCHVRRAYKTLKKCLEIQSLLLGPQHRKTRSTQRTVDKLARALEVGGRRQNTGSLRDRPPFCAVVPSHTELGGAKVTDHGLD